MKKKKLVKYFIIYIIIGSVFGFIIGVIGELKIFYRKPIVKKYSYFQTENNKYSFSFAATNKKKAAEMLNKFYKQDSNSIIVVERIFKVRPFTKIDVLEYSEDSVFAYIRDKHQESIKKGYVPVFTLFDTIPKCAPECFPELPMWLK